MNTIKVGNVTVTLQNDSKRYEEAVKNFIKAVEKEKKNVYNRCFKNAEKVFGKDPNNYAYIISYEPYFRFDRGHKSCC